MRRGYSLRVRNERGRELRILVLKNIKAGKDKELRENTEGLAKV